MTEPINFYGTGAGKCKRPSFKDINGRTWDYCDIILPNGETIQGHLDTTWGEYAYFMYDNQYRKIRMNDYEIMTEGYTNVFDLRTFIRNRLELESIRNLLESDDV